MHTMLFAAALSVAIFFGAAHGRPATHAGPPAITTYECDTISGGGPPGTCHP